MEDLVGKHNDNFQDNLPQRNNVHNDITAMRLSVQAGLTEKLCKSVCWKDETVFSLLIDECESFKT